ncbi:hemin uptake protein HemP [Ottowia thiooxydans]|uniref:hemin uptake protein HemP n=1 Tax=Ottowia thiooxydans TaxID=219182 RepID=UPI000490F5CF|nr:hemin uptake protein HemP [Ottowia thiooxydans]
MPSASDMPQPHPSQSGKVAAAAEPAVSPSPLPSNHLLQGRKTIEITHNGSVYRLQATKLGKLILTK